MNEPKNDRPLPIIANPNPFLDDATAPTMARSHHKHSQSNGPPLRPGSSPSMPPSGFWMYARSVQREANARDNAFPAFPAPCTSLPASKAEAGTRRRSNTAPSFSPSPRHIPPPLPPRAAPSFNPHTDANNIMDDMPAAGVYTTTHPAFRILASAPSSYSLTSRPTTAGSTSRRRPAGFEDSTTSLIRRKSSTASSLRGLEGRSEYEHLRKSPCHEFVPVPLGPPKTFEEMGLGRWEEGAHPREDGKGVKREKSKMLRKKRGQWGVVKRLGGGVKGVF